MEANSEAIIRLAWARQLSLADDALEDSGHLIMVERDDVLSFIRVCGAEVLAGPAGLLQRIDDDHRPPNAFDQGHEQQGAHQLDRLTDPHLLFGLLSDEQRRTARLLGCAELFYTDQYCDHPRLDGAAINSDPEAAAAVQRCCPPDDVTETELDHPSQRYVLYDDSDEPVALAMAQDWMQVIAPLSVLVGLPFRGRGWGRLVAAAAVNDLLDAGQIPGWRTRSQNRASMAVAHRLGFERKGSQTTVLLNFMNDNSTRQ
ncbi:GNAT family N-acetyltransferase [Microlunatus elymi]|uniref:GNAT family N-acetyltransferase n=1 Tax=Microlunatus elymi TaxID=2596828 RepID=A0A516PWF0_9ACTN|nr:GNAT family N-acetyltransferase [Microlunatus elymi]QDP95505.1 GNAT family N-acetyltransferase [Microlunatus elymi]